MHSLTEENYLKAIYRLSQYEKVKITPTAIANEIAVNAASVVDMLKKLTEKDLITYNKKNGAMLTQLGNKTAIGIVRKHRLWEVFLLDKLGYSWDVVHEIAEQLEHIKHHELADRLDKYLGYPLYDPHGDPIPNAQGEIPEMANTLLSELALSKTAKVAAIKDTSAVFLQYLQHLQINIGSNIKVLEKIAYDGSLIITIEEGNPTNVSKKFAENIIVN